MTDTTSKRSDAGKRLREYQQVLGSFTRIASESLPLGALLHHAAAQAARVTDIKRAKVMRYRPEKGDLIVAAGVGWKPGVVGHATLGMDHRSPPGRSIQTAGAVAIEDLPNDKEYDHSGLLQDHGVISLLNVPIMIDGRTWGVLEVDTQHKTKFDEVDVEFLGTMANIVAGAIARHEAEENSVQALTHAARQKLEAETALRELQHRTKNNLQVIISLLAIKKRQVESQEAREVLSAAMRRVEAVALAHDLLAPGDETGSVDLGEYLRSLCASFESEQRGINLQVDAAEARIPLNRAVPAALIVNELVTNSVKYAFGNAGGTIQVTLKVLAHCSEACIRVEDDGVGLKLPPKAGVGLKLVDGLSKQIGGRVQHLKVESGTSTQICFPVVFGQMN
jgi:two-component sensor histidine kinase/putative methionine-R-sulfoxide reductase with GAF domain